MNSEIISGNEKLKQIKLKVEVKDVKSDYFFNKTFWSYKGKYIT